MSNDLAIATVTAALCKLLGTGIGEAVASADVKFLRIDENSTGPSIYVYLYQVLPNAALRNSDLPTRTSQGNILQSPRAALDLHYLLTFVGEESDQVPQRLLGHAIKVLHDQPVLSQSNIQDAIDDSTWSHLVGSDLNQQVERVRFTPLSLDLEELSKLWSVFFQIPHLLSVVYRASVVLIDSDRPTHSALPVLRRGAEDQGATVRPDLIIPLPTLEAVTPPNQQPRAVLGDTLTITGHHLDATSINVIFENAWQDVRIVKEVDSDITATSFPVTIPHNEEADWPVGVYTVSAEVNSHITNKVTFLLAPKMTNVPINDQVSGNPLTINCKPEVGFYPKGVVGAKVRRGQRVSLLLADREIPAITPPPPVPPPPSDPPVPETPYEWVSTVEFDISDVPTGIYHVRLRVDGIDSLLVNRDASPPEYDDTQKVTITS